MLAGAATESSADKLRGEIAARIERLPKSRWHNQMRLVIGAAWFFDGFDAVAIAYVLPVLIPLWQLTPGQIGLLISIGYAGQLIGSVGFGWIAEKIGRQPVALVTLLIFSVMSIACALAWSFPAMLVFRFLQGLGLGGEVPIMQAYVNEFARARNRARFAMGVQVLFTVGIVGVALIGTWVVPHLGWQWMFVIGALPALLVLPMRRVLPESPRWLASVGRSDEAGRVLDRLEAIATDNGQRPLPPLDATIKPVEQAVTRVSDLFRGIYLKRTLSLWVLWFCTYLVTYGLLLWVPSLYRTVFKVSVQEALNYGFVTAFAGLVGVSLCALLADHTGRKPLFAGALLIASLPLFWLAVGPAPTVLGFIVFVSISICCNSITAIGLGTYTTENYPTHLRALGTGAAGGWIRLASMLGPLLVGAIMPVGGLSAVFAVFGVVGLVGVVVCVAFSIETRGKPLEELSPPITA
jgi:putative MFS transporter